MLPNHVPGVARAVGRESGRKSQPYFRARKHSTRGRHSQWNAFLFVLLLWPKNGRKSRPSFPSDFQASRAWNQVSTQRMANATLGMNVRFHKYDLVHTLGSGPNATHTMHRFAKKTQHARGLTILYPLRPGTLHSDFAVVPRTANPSARRLRHYSWLAGASGAAATSERHIEPPV